MDGNYPWEARFISWSRRMATARWPQGDPTVQQLYQGAEKPEERKPEESLCKCSHKSTLGVQGRGFDPNGRRSFFWPFFTSNSRDNDEFVHVPIQSWLSQIIICNVRDCQWLVVYCTFTSENIIRKRVILKKKKERPKRTFEPVENLDEFRHFCLKSSKVRNI